MLVQTRCLFEMQRTFPSNSGESRVIWRQRLECSLASGFGVLTSTRADLVVARTKGHFGRRYATSPDKWREHAPRANEMRETSGSVRYFAPSYAKLIRRRQINPEERGLMLCLLLRQDRYFIFQWPENCEHPLNSPLACE